MRKWTERTATLSVIVIGRTAIDTRSFTSLVMALLRSCCWLEISFFKYILLWRSKNRAFSSHTTSSIFSIIYSKSNPTTTLAGVTALHLFFWGTSGYTVPMADTSLSFYQYVGKSHKALNTFIRRIFGTAISPPRTFSFNSPTLILGHRVKIKGAARLSNIAKYLRLTASVESPRKAPFIQPETADKFRSTRLAMIGTVPPMRHQTTNLGIIAGGFLFSDSPSLGQGLRIGYG